MFFKNMFKNWFFFLSLNLSGDSVTLFKLGSLPNCGDCYIKMASQWKKMV